MPRQAARDRGGLHLLREDFMGNSRRSRQALSALSLLCALGVLATPAHADGSVSALHMGMGAKDSSAMMHFDAVIAQYNASGERFRIDSHCQSACTMFLSIRNVCITPNATLLFHAGGNRQKANISRSSTDHMLAAYNPALRQYVTEHHFMDTFELHPISGREIIARFGYPACR
jgi:hypothetical protein